MNIPAAFPNQASLIQTLMKNSSLWMVLQYCAFNPEPGALLTDLPKFRNLMPTYLSASKKVVFRCDTTDESVDKDVHGELFLNDGRVIAFILPDCMHHHLTSAILDAMNTPVSDGAFEHDYGDGKLRYNDLLMMADAKSSNEDDIESDMDELMLRDKYELIITVDEVTLKSSCDLPAHCNPASSEVSLRKGWDYYHQQTTVSPREPQCDTPIVFSPFNGAKLRCPNWSAEGYRAQARKEPWVINPWTGEPRSIEDIANDPHGKLINVDWLHGYAISEVPIEVVTS